MCCRLNSCCCGCTLRTGTLIIGILESIAAVFGVIGAVAVIVVAAENINGGLIDIGNGQVIDAKELWTAFRNIFIALACFSAFLLLINIMMLCGVTQKKTGLFLPWLVYEVIIILFNLATGIALTVIAFQNGVNAAGIPAIIYTLIYLVIRWYYVSVVYSYYKDLKDSNTV